MQSGIDSSRLRLAAETPMPTRAAAVESEKAEQTVADTVGTCRVEIGVKNPTKTGSCVPTTTAANASSKAFFGEDGPSFRDVLDSLNPLNQIPIVSDILANVTGHQPSTASKLAGGALATLISGPIGFAATLASVIFEDGAGQSPANAVYAAITGDESAAEPVQVANVDTAVEPVDATELASLETATGPTADAIANATMQARAGAKTGASGSSVLDLYGASGSSAHASYKKAQLLPYLRDVNHTKVL